MREELCDALLYQELGKFLVRRFAAFQFDYENIIRLKSVDLLDEIRQIMRAGELDDATRLSRIRAAFHSYGLPLDEETR